MGPFKTCVKNMNHRKFLDKSLETFSQQSPTPSRDGRAGDARKQALAEIEARQHLHRDRVAAAIRDGRLWPILKEEFARDYSALFDNLLCLELSVDRTFDESYEKETRGRHGKE